jgi:hypothetical protein
LGGHIVSWIFITGCFLSTEHSGGLQFRRKSLVTHPTGQVALRSMTGRSDEKAARQIMECDQINARESSRTISAHCP